jgi:hypothetical protein
MYLFERDRSYAGYELNTTGINAMFLALGGPLVRPRQSVGCANERIFTGGDSIALLPEAPGYGRPSLEQLVRMQDHGVNPKFINGLKEPGFQNVSIEQLVRMRDHAVNAAFITKMRSRGFTDSSIDELIKLADHRMNN